MKLNELYMYLNNDNNGIYFDEQLIKRINDEAGVYIEKYGYKVYSQNDEDGIISEIFKRVGTTNKKFIEFGVQGGIESNGHYLLLKGWSGLWIECDDESYKLICTNFDSVIKSGRLIVKKSFITRDNVNDIFRSANYCGEIDLLSIDVDGNDYHIMDSIEVLNARVIIIEYNAKIPPECEWVMPYNEEHYWDGGDKHGASLASMVKLFKKKGYILVGTNISGVNAFFVRCDLAEGKFAKDSSAENLYNPPRYNKKYFSGHPSLYCISDLSEGLEQFFQNKAKKNIVFLSGFGDLEIDSKSGKSYHWMTNTESILLFNKDKTKEHIEIEFDSDLLKNILNTEVDISIYLNGKIYQKLNNIESHGILRIYTDGFENEGSSIIKIGLKINCIINLERLGISEDARNLGLRIDNIS